MTTLGGRTALVTGGGRGLGRAIALALADAGADVAVLARDAAQVRDVAAAVVDRGRRGHGVAADVADGAAVAEAVRDTAGRLGPVDVLVLNAGVITPLGANAAVDPEEWARALDVNVAGAFRALRATLPAMLQRGWGRVVAISSGAATPPGMLSASAYSASKAALEALTLHVAREVAGSGVTANAVRPGLVDTPMQDLMRSMPAEQVGRAFRDRFHGAHERGELTDPAVPAGFVVRLVGTGLTGRVLDVRDASAHQLLAGAAG